MKTIFLMVVVPRDLPIAMYGVRAFLRCNKDDDLCVYFNGVEPVEGRAVFSSINDSRLCFYNNWEYICSNQEVLTSQVGKTVEISEGRYEKREGIYEKSSEIWSRELIRFTEYEFVGIIDPDFEVLDSGLFLKARTCLLENHNIGYYSSNYSEERVYFNTYGNNNIISKARYPTWFCIYRRSALEIYPFFHYVWKKADVEGRPNENWDHSAYLQEVLSSQHGIYGSAAPPFDWWQFIHYGAFAKNRDLSGVSLRIYRFFRLMKHSGYYHLHRNKNIQIILMFTGRICFKALRLTKYDKQRKTYAFEG